jgi:hypothetical protein
MAAEDEDRTENLLFYVLGKIEHLVIHKLSNCASKDAHNVRGKKRYHTVGIGSSGAYCGGKYIELVIAALKRGGFVRPPCAYWHE